MSQQLQMVIFLIVQSSGVFINNMNCQRYCNFTGLLLCVCPSVLQSFFVKELSCMEGRTVRGWGAEEHILLSLWAKQWTWLCWQARGNRCKESRGDCTRTFCHLWSCFSFPINFASYIYQNKILLGNPCRLTACKISLPICLVDCQISETTLWRVDGASQNEVF